jgi:Ser/Thr protein kinase RdoA (MazF antagonist)
MLTSVQARDILSRLGFASTPDVCEIKQNNHVYLMECGSERFYLKTYTKDWYGDDIGATAGCVDHEATAWRVLSEAGIPVPDVVAADMTLVNPLGRPFIMTRALAGRSLPQRLAEAGPEERAEILVTVGRMMRQMHSITFPFPGYVTSNGLNTLPDPNGWRHSIWAFEVFERETSAVWQQDRLVMDGELVNQAENLYLTQRDRLQAGYALARFVHGDCHASSFFVNRGMGEWTVTGIIDMEVASAGDIGHDFLKFFIEMATLPAVWRWWEPFFRGYGDVRSVDEIKVRMLAAHPENYTWIWPGTREAIFRHLLEAEHWTTLFDLTHLRSN